MRRAHLLFLGVLAGSIASADPLDRMVIWTLSPHDGADPRAELEIHPVPGLDGPTGDQVWILHRQGRFPRWSGCSEAAVWTDSVNLSLGRPDRDTAWEPHLMLHELLSWLVPEPLVRRVSASHRRSLHACGMVWTIQAPSSR
jgi:hypothetical protein